MSFPLPRLIACLAGMVCLYHGSVRAVEEAVVAEGLHLSEAVVGGLVEQPVMATLDDRGRLYAVVRDADETDTASILLLEDKDADGVFDQSTGFAKELSMPGGILEVAGAIYTTSRGRIWLLEDQDGDGVAEVKESIQSGAVVSGEGSSLVGPFLHPSGRLYWGQSDEKPRLWSNDINGRDLLPATAEGTVVPDCLGFTVRGELIGPVRRVVRRPIESLYQFVPGADLRGQKSTGVGLPPIVEFPFNKISAILRGGEGTLGRSGSDTWLIALARTREIVRTELRRERGTFAGREIKSWIEWREPDSLLQWSDPECRVRDLLRAHNGDLLILTDGRLTADGSENEQSDSGIGIYRLSASPNYEPPERPDWERLTTETVSAYLGHETEWIQDRAMTELAMRGAPAIPELDRILIDREGSVTARRNAVWTLARMSFSEAADQLYAALTDPAPGVRQAAAFSIGVTRAWHQIAANQPAEFQIELHRNTTIVGALAAIVRSDDSAVAAEAAVALGRMGDPRAVGALFGRVGRENVSPHLEHALIAALIALEDPAALRSALQTTENEGIQNAALRALGSIADVGLNPLDFLSRLDEPSLKLRRTAAAIAKQHPEWDGALATQF
ncbi:MAG: hypothetical protein AAF236_00440, partial [Verrucomicrobiota bacterium]